jgi:hypothetical protein
MTGTKDTKHVGTIAVELGYEYFAEDLASTEEVSGTMDP